MKELPIGIDDFKNIIDNEYFYADKSLFIKEISKNIGKTLLFTRPRRFGKTLNMSMVKYFYDIKGNEKNRELFKNLNIEKTSIMAEQGQYPVIFISFKEVKFNTYEKLFEQVKILISEVYRENIDILEGLNSIDKEVFIKYLKKEANEVEVINSLKFLSQLLYDQYGKKVVVLIDEYDTAIVSAYENDYYKEAMEFFRGLYSSTLKGNKYLYIGVMTGILRVAKEGIFSGLNNLMVYSILDDDYSQYFGLTEDEVESALKYYQIEYKLEAVKDWYNGYKFGNTEIYNPWSILYYIESRLLKSYWVNSSDNFLINEVLKEADNEIFEDLKKLFSGESVEQYIDENLLFDDLTVQNSLWSLLLYTGYLSLDKIITSEKISMKIPNREIYSFFRKVFLEKISNKNTRYFEDMITNLKKKRIVGENSFESNLRRILQVAMSSYDNKEAFYHGFVLGLMVILEKEYIVLSNTETGDGRADIILEPRYKNHTGYIFEFKLSKIESEEKLEYHVKEALEQIEKKKNTAILEERGVKDIVKIGIAFYKKNLLVDYK